MITTDVFLDVNTALRVDGNPVTVPFQPRFSLPLAGVLFLMLSQVCLAAAPSPEELSNATYSVTEEGPVTLTNGRWEGKPFVAGGASFPSLLMAKDFYLAGDLNGDGDEEAVVLLWSGSGGTGTFNYLIVADRENHKIRTLGIAEIGDRVQLRNGWIEDARIVLEVVQHSEDDPACCPSELATRSWSLVDGQLQEGETQITGKLSLATLDGTEWVLTHLKQNEAMLPEAEVTLLFAADRVSGKSACNRYSAGIEQGSWPGELKIGQAMGTRMACPGGLMELEQQYLDALSRVNTYSFQAGKLVLNWQKDDEWFAMFFTRLN